MTPVKMDCFTKILFTQWNQCLKPFIAGVINDACED
jgi:hypothetical protein